MENYICPRCGLVYPVGGNHWVCDDGSILEMQEHHPIDPSHIRPQSRGVWRYAHTLPISDPACIVSLGEGGTPLVPLSPGDESLYLKLEYTNPTGSFKDRGATVMISMLKQAGVGEVVEDSSGNAGSALAAYAARAGILCHIYVPASHSTAKLRQIQAYGADLVPIHGSRSDTARAAVEAARSSYYASHAHSPLYVEGCKTIAYEIWEQLGRKAPGMIITPVGQGSILLGLEKGFCDLQEVGLIDEMPHLVGVQAEACSPLVTAYQRGLDAPIAVECGETIAEGIKIAAPVRGSALLSAVRDTGGAFLAVSDDATLQAKTDLARRGIYVEATSATALAAYRLVEGQGIQSAPVVLILTGSGLKTG